MPTWKNQKHGQQWINTLRDYAFPKIGRMPIDSIGQPEVLMCLFEPDRAYVLGDQELDVIATRDSVLNFTPR